ncbi:MAG TPA: glycerol-3-phosphate acyltransferase, partial [Oculatellaceae cyanobacterium]
ALHWPTGLFVGLAAFLLTKITRIQSVSSMTASLLGVLSLWLFHSSAAYITYAVVAASYIIYLHKANIVRLINGTENRI